MLCRWEPICSMTLLYYFYTFNNKQLKLILLIAIRQFKWFQWFSILILLCFQSKAQLNDFKSDSIKIIQPVKSIPYNNEKDLVDIGYLILRKDPLKRLDSTGKQSKKVHFSGAPGAEYTLTTDLAVIMSGDLAFYTYDNEKTSISSILMATAYTQKKQFYTPIQSNIWTKNNEYNFLGDYRFYKFPQDTYGFGGYTSMNNGYVVNYDYVRFYEVGLKSLGHHFYMGLGFQFDYHWNISEILNPNTVVPTDFEKYGFSKTSTSSGIAFDFLYDDRKNSINPEGGAFYSNIVFRQNSNLLGSNTNWNSLLIDIRKYFQVSPHNILAIWTYNYLTLSGNAPYLDLPGTETDTYGNTGRGYILDRFIGKKMIDFEAEYRYAISRNGLLGGVVFVNAESTSELKSNRFEVLSPGGGFGIRFKFNKFSRTNICLDYAWGLNGSHGIFANLGEVF